MGIEKLSATMQNSTTMLAIEAIFGKNIFTDKGNSFCQGDQDKDRFCFMAWITFLLCAVPEWKLIFQCLRKNIINNISLKKEQK